MTKIYNVSGSMIALFLARASADSIGCALGRIWDCQTASEKQSRSTEQTNGVGFSAFDAKEGSYIAKWCRDMRKGPNGKFLVKASKLAHKYREQLATIYGSKPELFEADFGLNLAIAMRRTLGSVAEENLSGRLEPKSGPLAEEVKSTVTAKVSFIDGDGVVHEKVYEYKGTNAAADMLRAFDKFANSATKQFVAGKVLPQALPGSGVSPFIGGQVCKTG